MRSAALVPALLAALAALPASAGAPPSSAGGPSGTGATAPRVSSDPEARATPAASVLEEVSGTVAAVDRVAQRVEITTAQGPVTLQLDRNTLVYAQDSVGTVLDLAVGQPVRAGRNATFTAYWVQLRPAPAKAAPGAKPGPASGPTPADPAQAAHP